ncbi:hypothetical protein GWK47_017646 [Chionoecetes opilio]|uniref:Uncharacterized protein n=1 Tax=Chionoecetes opilio TaxID=41210 RepID=A0A8J5BYE1_CHIOP|nr:hypothetical protein GWK47_017646 [Chionoecetes opilio]
MKEKVLGRQGLPTRPSGIKHVCSNTITQCYEEQERDSSQAAQHLEFNDNVSGKRARTHSSEATTSGTSCFFCGKSGTETLHEVATFQVDTRVRKCAAQLGTIKLRARLSMGDMGSGGQEDSVPNVLVAMVNMVRMAPASRTQSHSSSRQAALSIAQLLKFNSVKQSRKQGATKTQEPPAVRHSSLKKLLFQPMLG